MTHTTQQIAADAREIIEDYPHILNYHDPTDLETALQIADDMDRYKDVLDAVESRCATGNYHGAACIFAELLMTY